MVIYYLTLFFSALLSTLWIFPKIHKIAIDKNITDSPNIRKLQKAPVPCLGGAVVFFGMMFSLLVSGIEFEALKMFTTVCAFVIMLYIGTMDDILSLSPRSRLLVEILVVVLLMYGGCGLIDDFHGLWGIREISTWIAVPLTIFACVGIINAINLIDGVNGLSSGYCIMACLIFGGVAILSGDIKHGIIAVISIGSLIPFFCHNVFGMKSKMFIGDGGTLLMGIVMADFVIGLLCEESSLGMYVDDNFGVVPFTLAVLVIPVFDTLRVMISRMFAGHSPFSPDKTHLHHLLFRLHFSHIGTTLTEIVMNLFIIVMWAVCWRCGVSIDMQLYVVVILGFLFTFGVYWFVSYIEKKQNRSWALLVKLGDWTHVGHKNWFLKFTAFLDKGY